MLFKATIISDTEIGSYIDETGRFRLRTTKYIIPAGTIVDVYGVSSFPNGSNPDASFVIYHNSLPHFCTVSNMVLRPLQ